MTELELGTDRFYFIETPDRSDFLLRGMTGGSGRVLMVFQTGASAQALIDRFQIGGNMTVSERNRQETYELVCRAREMGVEFLAPIRPGEEAADQLKFVPIQTMLLALELEME
jgi:hypothetical protein